MIKRVLLALTLSLGLGRYCLPQASPYNLSSYDAQTFTASGTTGTAIQLSQNPNSPTTGGSFGAGVVSVTGSGLTTVTFAVQGSNDGGASYFPLYITSGADPTVGGSTITATTNGIYQVNLAGLTHVRFVTSGTFTASSVALRLTASPNASARSGGPGGSGPGAGVSSFNGRTGAVSPQTNDYTFGQIAGTASTGQIPNLDASKVTTGTFSTSLFPNGGVTTINSTPCTLGSSCTITASATVNSTATINAANSQVQAESVVTSTAFGAEWYGDSITAAQGAASQAGGYAYLMAAHYKLPFGTIGTTYAYPVAYNYGISGDNACDLTSRMMVTSGANPGDNSNAIRTMEIGTNNVGGGSAGVPAYKQCHLAAMTWGALSSSNKILAGNAAVTQTSGTWTATTTYPAANGLSTTAAGTLTYAGATLGQRGVYYAYFGTTKAATASFTLATDGVPATDTITGLTTITTAAAPTSSSATNGMIVARVQSTPGAHSLSISWAAGTLNFLGWGIPPDTRTGGMNGPRMVVGGVPPQQNNANSANVAIYNAANLADSQLGVADGLNTPFVDSNSLDPIIDFANSTAPGLHPGPQGHVHLADKSEAVIGAVSSPFNPTVNQQMSYNTMARPTAFSGFHGGNNTTNDSGSGTTFNPQSFCMVVPSGQCWGGMTQFDATTYMLVGAAGGLSIVPSPNGSTPTTLTTASNAIFRATTGGVGKLVALNVNPSGSLSVQLAVPTDIRLNSAVGYHQMYSAVSSTTALMGGINIQPSSGAASPYPMGIHAFYSANPAKYGLGAYYSNSQNFYITPYSGTNPTFASFTGTTYFDGSGNLVIPRVAATSTTGSGFNQPLYTPASSAATCTAGDFADDASFHYVCTATNTWKRIALTAF